MGNLVIIGLQWGDEGKGKVVDLLCPAFNAVVRYQGGHNAGHTVRFADKHFALHLVPSGILHAETRCVLAHGMVVSPPALFEELDELAGAEVEAEDRLFVSDRAHLLLPLYGELDQARELRRGERAIGTTGRGIGPAYELKAARLGLRLGELRSDRLEERLTGILERVRPELEESPQAEVPQIEALVAECRAWGERLAPYLADTIALLHQWDEAGDAILFEGAQGTLLDLDQGTYPFVTSSSATAGGASTGSGVAPSRLGGVLGIVKAYTSRVGAGPFPTELHDAVGEHLRRRGNEFGTTTGRPRRCGWLDLVALEYAVKTNGVSTIALTKLDVLDELEEIRVCAAYRLNDRETTRFPGTVEELERAEPIWESLPGWQEETVGTLTMEELPARAQEYVRYLETKLGVSVGLISTGPRREETIVRADSPLVEWLGDRRLEMLSLRG